MNHGVGTSTELKGRFHYILKVVIMVKLLPKDKLLTKLDLAKILFAIVPGLFQHGCLKSVVSVGLLPPILFSVRDFPCPQSFSRWGAKLVE